MEKKVIEILINQLEDYCYKTNCYKCACFLDNHDCLFGKLKDCKNKPIELIKFFYSLDEGLEVFNNEKD